MTATRRSAMIAAFVVLVAMAAVVPAEPAAAGPGEAKLEWLALGDSYSSGTGAEGQVPMSGQKVLSDNVAFACQQYTPTYSNQARNTLMDGGFEFSYMIGACYGATANKYWDDQTVGFIKDGQLMVAVNPSQRSYFGERNFANRNVDIVTLTFGGNDLRFGSRMTQCWDSNCDFTLQDIRDELPDLKSELKAVYRDIRSLMDRTGYLYVLGYPYIFADPRHWDDDPCDAIIGLGSIGNSEGRLIINATDLVDDATRDAVAELGDSHVRFIDPRGIWSNANGVSIHGICHETRAEWIRAVDRDDMDQSYHPNRVGYRKLSELVADQIRRDF